MVLLRDRRRRVVAGLRLSGFRAAFSSPCEARTHWSQDLLTLRRVRLQLLFEMSLDEFT